MMNSETPCFWLPLHSLLCNESGKIKFHNQPSKYLHVINRLSDKEFLAVWGVLRNYQQRYKFSFGGMFYGMPTLVIGTLISMAMNDFTPVNFLQFLILTIACFLSGVIMGTGMYNYNEQRYQKLKSTTDSNSPN